MNKEETRTADSFRLDVPEHVRELLDKRTIRLEDVRLVIMHGESTGEKIMNGENRHFISHLAIGSIICWAEYSAMDCGYALHNAYFHRIRVREE
jgi:hypothetical protein